MRPPLVSTGGSAAGRSSQEQRARAPRACPRESRHLCPGHKTPLVHSGLMLIIRDGARVGCARSAHRTQRQPLTASPRSSVATWTRPGGLDTFRRVRTSPTAHTNPCVGGSVYDPFYIYSHAARALSRARKYNVICIYGSMYTAIITAHHPPHISATRCALAHSPQPRSKAVSPVRTVVGTAPPVSAPFYSHRSLARLYAI